MKHLNIRSVVMLTAGCIMLALGGILTGCDNHDEPTPPDPPIDNDSIQQKEWGDETPFFLLDEVTSFTIQNKNEEGFLMNVNKGCDYFVLVNDWVVGAPSTSKGITKGNVPVFFSGLFDGVRVSPVENETRYNELCLKMGAKPLSALNDTTVLGDLPFYVLRYNHTLDTIASMESFCDRSPLTGEMMPEGESYKNWVLYLPSAEKVYIKQFLNNLYPPHEPVGICIYGLSGDSFIGNRLQYVNWFETSLGLEVVMPDEPGIYNITVRIKLTNGKMVEDSVKIKFMPEGSTYPDGTKW